jgi:hypothetical protein
MHVGIVKTSWQERFNINHFGQCVYCCKADLVLKLIVAIVVFEHLA